MRLSGSPHRAAAPRLSSGMKRRILLLALAAVVAGLVLGWPRGPAEPVHQGKSLTRWIRDANDIGIFEQTDETKAAMKAMGTNALPWLMAQLARPPSKWRAKFNHWSRQHKRWRFRFTGDERRTALALGGLELLGPDITPALPELARHLDDPGRSVWVARVMAGAGAPAVPCFLEGLASTNVFAHSASLHGLYILTGQHADVVPPLIHALQSTNASIRRYAAQTLGEVTFRPDITIPALAAAMADPDLQVRREAVLVLNLLPVKSADLIPELRRQMQDTNPAVVLRASNALEVLQALQLPPRLP